MSEPGMRPGGLTALAVMSFIFAAAWVGGAVQALSRPAMAGVFEHVMREEERRDSEAATRSAGTRPRHGMKPEEREDLRELTQRVRATPFYIFGLAAIVRAFGGLLLLIAGIGYIKLRRFLGKWVGTAFGLLTIGWAAAQMGPLKERMPEDFGYFGMIGLLFGVFTLFAVHVVFKNDFVNP